MNENTRQGRTDIWSWVIAVCVVLIFALLTFREQILVWLA